MATRPEQSKAQGRHLRLALFWAALGGIAAAMVMPYATAVLKLPVQDAPLPMPLLIAAQALQLGVLLVLLGWLGLRAGAPLGLDSPLARALVYRAPVAPPRPGRSLAVAALAGLVVGGLIAGAARLFAPLMPPAHHPVSLSFARWQGFLASFYGGIVEELFLRLFLMTALVWCAWKLILKAKRAPGHAVFWTAIVLAALVFAAGHLPAAARLWPLTAAVVARTIVLNLLAGIPFGFLYWRLGLEHAMLAHFWADIVLKVLLPTV
ncbi:MAG: hypothetical protein AMJ81_11965 [Phycisphaerae bacterium SM23_33]|nr:MAG: hypothetical protein AMJ81_11965 [Phycisphaerae bacterium SM23_33]